MSYCWIISATGGFGSFGFLPLPCFKVPDPTPEWTAVPISVLTASSGLEIAGNIKQGQNVLVTAAAGGTGHIAVQWAKKMYGCRVAGTCGSEAKSRMLKGLGCDVIVNYRTDDVEAVLAAEFPNGFDVVFEGVGGRIGNIARRLLAPTGRNVQIGMVSTDYTGATKGDSDGKPVKVKEGQKDMFYFVGDWKTAGKTEEEWDTCLAKTLDAVSTGKIRIVMAEECKSFVGLEGVYEAQAFMRSGKNIGKIYATVHQTSTRYLETEVDAVLAPILRELLKNRPQGAAEIRKAIERLANDS
jgi:NADPH-dependent curcumin reductase CurA